jgi:RNA polymerase sigma factor (sigma-70 family)
MAGATRINVQLAADSMHLRRREMRILSLRRPSAERADQRADAKEPLLVACQAGVPEALDRLVAAYAPMVRAVIGRYLATRRRGRPDLVDDLTHEVFLALFRDDARRLKSFQGRDGCSFAGWLRVVAVRVAIDALRREQPVLSLDDDTPAMIELRRSLASAGPDPEAVVRGTETADRLREVIASLGAKDRLLVELHLLRGTPLPAVAHTLGVTANAAYVRKSRVLERLRRHLEGTR